MVIDTGMQPLFADTFVIPQRHIDHHGHMRGDNNGLNSLRQIGGSLCSTLLVLAATAVSTGGVLDLTGFRAAALLTAAPVLLSLLLWLRRRTSPI